MEREIVIHLKVPCLTKRQRSIVIVAALVCGSAAGVYAAVPNTFSAGEPLSASKLNDNFSSLQGQITSAAFGTRVPSAFHATLTAATTTMTAATKILFNQIDFDLAGEYNNVTGAFITRNTGIYLVTCSLFFTAAGVPLNFTLQVTRNGGFLSLVDTQSSTSTTDDGGVALLSVVTVQLTSGDTVQCSGGLNGGSPATLDTNSAGRNTFSATRLY